jgi:hypothetical protein
MNELTVSERERLRACEEIIDAGLEKAFAVGDSLAVIQQERLYRATHDNFEDYCRDRFNRGRDWAEGRIRAVQVLKALPMEIGNPPPTLEQAKVLAKLDPEQRAEVWQKVSKHGKPKTKKVKEEVAKVRDHATKRVVQVTFRKDLKEAKWALGRMYRAMCRLGMEPQVKDHISGLLKILDARNGGPVD